MISVIIPVYNVEQYLRQCIDSVLAQTYSSIEIILIDDGSTDSSGTICEEYRKNKSIKVFHTTNRGLSAARNFGIEKSTGEYIYFLDSDDWIDADFLEKAMEKISEADILCFSKFEGKYSGIAALIENINGRINNYTWSKLFKRECFLRTLFPEGRVHEDKATTYIFLHQAKMVVCADIKGHHYRDRAGSITNVHDEKNILDYRVVVNDRYDYCMKAISSLGDSLSSLQLEEIFTNLMKYRAIAIIRAWAWRNELSEINKSEWEKMSYEARTLFPLKIRRKFPFRIRGGLFLARYNCWVSFWISNKVHLLTRKFFIVRERKRKTV